MNSEQIQEEAVRLVAAVMSGHNLDKLLTVRDAAGNPDLSAVKNIVYGVLREYASLAYKLKFYIKKFPRPAMIKYLLITAAYQLLFTGKPPYAIVDAAVNNAGKIAAGTYKNLVNAVLRNFLRADCARSHLIPAAAATARYNLPQWWIDKIRREFPRQYEAIFTAWQQPPPLTLRLNCRKTSAVLYREILREAGIAAVEWDETAIYLPRPLPVDRIPYFAAGYVSVQDWGAQAAAKILAPAPGTYILDACAAPGGKTGHILELAACRVLALDINSARLAKVESNLSRLGLHAALCCAAAEKIDDWWDGEPFDAVLADLPCSASGVVKRHPDIRWLRQEGDAAKIAVGQIPLLDNLWSVLKNKGRMLIATCSIFFEENQGQLAGFLHRNPNAVLLAQRQLLPNPQHDGFYYALVEKI